MAITKNNGSAFATAFTNSKPTTGRPWRMGSLGAALQESSSPICNSPNSDAFYFEAPTGFSSPRLQATGFSSPTLQSTRSNFDNLSTSSFEVDKCVQIGRNLGGFYQYGLQNHSDNEIKKQNCSSKSCLSISSAYHSAVSAIDPKHHSTSSSSIEEASSTHERNNYLEPECTNNNSSHSGSPNSGHHKFVTRPKPYNEFLHKVKANQLQAQIEAWKKAKHEELMNKQRRKEADIDDWKFKQITKAMKEMEKIEGKLERIWAQAQERTQKRISSARKEADKKTTKVRESTVKEISRIPKESEKIHSTNNSIWLKLIKFCY